MRIDSRPRGSRTCGQFGVLIPGLLALAAVATGLALRPAGLEAQGTATQVRVRVVSHDAKIIGSGVGGARVTIRDQATGEVLAQGTQEGSTGDTRAIVVEAVERGAPIYDTPEAAHFDATLRLTEPTRVTIEAQGPLGTPHAVQRTSLTTLLLPGVDVLGNGFVLELHGFTVEILQPREGPPPGGTVSVQARVTMLCGCPIEPGGLWDADRLQVSARLVRGGEVLEESEMSFAGRTSVFQGIVPAVDEGPLELQVLVSDPSRANFGMAALPLGGG